MTTTTRLRDEDGYYRLRDAILRGDLVPNQRLVEADMSSTFELPRAAVRTALLRLEHEGLIERVPHRGARVRLVTEQEAVEILQARAALEGLAAREAALGITPGRAKELRAVLDRQHAALEEQDLMRASDVNAQLHAKIVELSGHATAQRLVKALNSQMVRFQFRTILIPGRPRQSHAGAPRDRRRRLRRGCREGRARDAQASQQRRARARALYRARERGELT